MCESPCVHLAMKIFLILLCVYHKCVLLPIGLDTTSVACRASDQLLSPVVAQCVCLCSEGAGPHAVLSQVVL